MVAASPKSAGKLRIIAGQWRGRKLAVADVDGLRPTGDRIRETLFNWLQADIYGARCLDLFAGSGALGFEALSRGAAAVDFVEPHPKAAKQLRENCKLLSAEASIHEQEADQFLRKTRTPYSLVFIDPPFSLKVWEASFRALEEGQLLTEDAMIYIESPVGSEIVTPASWEKSKSKASGRVQFALYQKKTQEKAQSLDNNS